MRKNLIIETAASLCLAIAGAGAFAQLATADSYDLDFYDEEFNGENVLRLKQRLADEYPELDVRELELESVTLVAKTRYGRGQARLIVGQDETRWVRVAGNPGDFDNPSRRTFSHEVFDAPYQADSRGVWQMELNGNFKVRSVVLNVLEPRRTPRTEYVRCESRSYRYKECATNGSISRVWLHEQLSNTRCVRGSNWGVVRDSIWVNEGCRGVFAVEHGRSRRDPGDRDDNGRDDNDGRNDDNGRDENGRDRIGDIILRNLPN